MMNMVICSDDDDNGDGDGNYNDEGDDEGDERKMMILMLRRRNLTMLRRKTDPKTGSTLCASRRCRNAGGHVARTIWYGHGQEKWPWTPPGTMFCANLRNRNAHEQGYNSHCEWKFTRETTGDTSEDSMSC